MKSRDGVKWRFGNHRKYERKAKQANRTNRGHGSLERKSGTTITHNVEESQVGFEVLTAVSMKMAVFWVVVTCSLEEVYQRFRGPCCLHHQDDES
jgi:hypothetical protein